MDELQTNLVCYSVQEHLFAALVEIAERAAALLGARGFLCVGGVGCNARLQAMLAAMAAARGAALGAMDERYCVDNGAMVSWCGQLARAAVAPEAADVSQRWRTDQVDVAWRE